MIWHVLQAAYLFLIALPHLKKLECLAGTALKLFSKTKKLKAVCTYSMEDLHALDAE